MRTSFGGPRFKEHGSSPASPSARASGGRESVIVVDLFCRPSRGSFLVLLLLPMAYAMVQILPSLRGL
jgi:hypothetical protein